MWCSIPIANSSDSTPSSLLELLHSLLICDCFPQKFIFKLFGDFTNLAIHLLNFLLLLPIPVDKPALIDSFQLFLSLHKQLLDYSL